MIWDPDGGVHRRRRAAVLPAQGLALPRARSSRGASRQTLAARPNRLRRRTPPGGGDWTPAALSRGWSFRLHEQPNAAAATFSGLVNLAAAALGGSALGTNDDFFAGMENLIQPGRGVFNDGKFTDRGKWMDGWESRRKRDAWARLVRAGARGAG